jgi:hypothetical protein
MLSSSTPASAAKRICTRLSRRAAIFAARQAPQLLAFTLVQVNLVLYVHLCPRSGWQQR